MEKKFIPLEFNELSIDEMTERSKEFLNRIKKRRTVRDFSDKPVPFEIIKNCILAAGSAPSGANLQPWHFVIVKDPDVKKKIREAAEKEEHEFYTKRATKEWLDALAPLGTDENKPYLEKAPFLIAVFEKRYGITGDEKIIKHYYSNESTGIAAGFLIAALHNAGLASLTHTPSPMNFLNKILERPANERPFLLLVTGYPAAEAKVPDIKKKNFAEIATVA